MILALQQQQIDVPQNSWVGHMSMAGVGIVMLVFSAWCIRGRKRKGSGEIVSMGPWGPLIVSVGDRLITDPTKRMLDKWSKRDDMEGIDWKSLMTWGFGAFGMTAIVSSQPGAILSIVEWFQGIILGIADWPVIADIGAAGLCFFLLGMAMRSRDDDMKDLMYGAICGFLWPLGGGWFADVTFAIGQWIPQLLQIG